jgi:hypothetical protein
LSSSYESADLLLKLYESRREATMRQARQWFITFNPGSADDIVAAIRGEHSADFRMVTTFWDMAAAFVNNGAIDERMFNDTNGEHLVVFAKLEPFLAEYRTRTKAPQYLKQLEQVVRRLPDARERLAALRERFAQMAAAKATVATR